MLSERELAEVWQARRYGCSWLVDCCGRPLRVVFPGRRWGGPGPDFVGALLARRDGLLVRGDVELHRRASDWAGHRHALDPAYAHVVLHVVQVADAMAVDARGQHIPAVVLEPPPALLAGQRAASPRAAPLAQPCIRAAPRLLQVVQAAGRERFRARVARFEGDLSAAEPDQVLWRGLAEGLGFQRNTTAFGLLADGVGWPEARRVALEAGAVGVAGLLLGSAGLVSECGLPEAHAWWRLVRNHGLRAVLHRDSWDRRQVRWSAAPAQRCRGLAELAVGWAQAGYAAGGLAEQALAAVAQAAAARRPRLWAFCYAPPWIGRGRAQVLAINVLVPFAAAAGLESAEALYERLPGEPANRVLRYMAAQLGQRFRGACQQQGLLQLFKQTCASRACERCPARRARLELDAASA